MRCSRTQKRPVPCGWNGDATRRPGISGASAWWMPTALLLIAMVLIAAVLSLAFEGPGGSLPAQSGGLAGLLGGLSILGQALLHNGRLVDVLALLNNVQVHEAGELGVVVLNGVELLAVVPVHHAEVRERPLERG